MSMLLGRKMPNTEQQSGATRGLVRELLVRVVCHEPKLDFHPLVVPVLVHCHTRPCVCCDQGENNGQDMALWKGLDMT
eukprot:5438925-Amphidinium_carterae.1